MHYPHPVIHYMLAFCLLLTSTHGLAQFSGGGMNAVAKLKIMQDQADKAYEQQQYKQAFSVYSKLAEVGDKFSQHRIAVMYANGQFVEQDLVMAYAWSYLSAETGIEAFRNAHESYKTMLNDAGLEKAREQAGELIRKLSIYYQASINRKLLHSEKFRCTGSRVGNTCASLKVVSFGCGVTAETPPSDICLRMGTMGINGVAGELPLRVKHAEQQMELLMERYNPGRVELGDFELIDEQGAAETEPEFNE